MLLSQNSKIKKSLVAGKPARVYNFTLPAFRSVTGIVTCPNAGICASGCYARSGAYRFSNVAKKHETNLQATLRDNFINQISLEITKLKATHIRIHDSGDFYSADYLNKWLTIIQGNSTVQFYAYTKQVSLIKSLSTLPANFTIIFSQGGKQDSLIRSSDRHSRVFESIDQLKSLGYVDASHNDMLALTANHRVGLVYHGNKSYNNTAWNRQGG